MENSVVCVNKTFDVLHNGKRFKVEAIVNITDISIEGYSIKLADSMLKESIKARVNTIFTIDKQKYAASIAAMAGPGEAS